MEGLSLITWPSLATTLYLLSGAVYRLYPSTLSKFPGSKLAALTLWYETYDDIWHRGQDVYEIKRMHEIYGEHRSESIWNQ